MGGKFCYVFEGQLINGLPLQNYPWPERFKRIIRAAALRQIRHGPYIPMVKLRHFLLEELMEFSDFGCLEQFQFGDQQFDLLGRG